MTAIAWITVGTTIGIVSPWLYLRATNRPRRGLPRGSAKRTQPAQSGNVTDGPYAAISLLPCLEACPAAWKMQGERFLSGAAPTLPLADCDQATCNCRYRNHDDRRTDDDRRDNWGQFGGFVPHSGNDKRSADRDRRTKARYD